MISCMINANSYMTAFDNAGVSPYGDCPIKVMLGNHGPFEVDRVEVDTSGEPPLGAVLYVNTDVLPSNVAAYLTADAESGDQPTVYAEGSPDTQRAEVGDDAFTPQGTADQTPASGGSGGVSSDTGPKAQTKW